MASPSCKVFVAGVDDEKMITYLEEFDISADSLLSDSESDGFLSEQRNCARHAPKISEEEASNLSLFNAIDKKILK